MTLFCGINHVMTTSCVMRHVIHNVSSYWCSGVVDSSLLKDDNEVYCSCKTCIVWRLRGNIIRTVLYIANVLPLQWAQLTKTVHTALLGLEFVFLFFLGCMICIYVGVCFVLPWTVESFPFFMFWRWHNKLKWAPFELFAPSSSLRVRSWLHPFKGHCEQKAMQDEWIIYVAGHPLLNRRCTRLPGCFYFPKCKL